MSNIRNVDHFSGNKITRVLFQFQLFCEMNSSLYKYLFIYLRKETLKKTLFFLNWNSIICIHILIKYFSKILLKQNLDLIRIAINDTVFHLESNPVILHTQILNIGLFTWHFISVKLQWNLITECLF